MFARIITGLAVAVSMTAPAFAQADALSVSVRIADLDLASAEDRVRLDRRIRKAADSVCNNRTGGLGERAAYVACMTDALAPAEQEAARIVALRERGVQLAGKAR
jgi:UrcA family protein